jgi:hypothetical protein
MGPVQPVGQGIQPGIGISPTAGADGAAASAGVSSTALTASVSSMRITMVHTSVDAMLAQIGGGVQNDTYLRMIIALLILNALLNGERASSDSAVGLPNASRPPSSASLLSLHSETNSIQIQEQSVMLATNQAVQTISDGGDSQTHGGRVDLHV